MEEAAKQPPKQLQAYVWKKGQSGNPAGRPPGKTLKEFAREYLMTLPDDEKVDYLASPGAVQGAIIISPTGYGHGPISGHTGFLGKYGKMYPGDYGIVSNDSNTGLLLELWDLTRWQKYYGQQGGLPVAFFRAL